MQDNRQPAEQGRSRRTLGQIFWQSVLNIGVAPSDDVDARLQKTLLVVCAFPFAVSGMLWGILYYAVGAPLAASIPFSYGVFSLLSIAIFHYSKRFWLFRFSQLFLILLLPFLLMMTLGGYTNGSAVIVWAIICPIGAMLFENPERAFYWFLAFVGMVLISGVIDPFLQVAEPLSPALRTTFFTMNLAAVSSLVFMMVFYFVRQKNEFQEQSEALLLNVLPKSIADQLKGDHRTIADHYDSASVLFADVVDFTPLSAHMSPGQLVNMLNDVFSEFDELVDALGLEKIKTIGDCYMVAAGVPTRREDHAEVLVQLALDMLDCVSKRNFQGRKLQFRIGINSGPIVAGVIGRKKFIYDLWGDTVNIASRMETHGEGGHIQITKETLDRVGDKFICKSRGMVDVKGKGPTETWFVVGPA